MADGIKFTSLPRNSTGLPGGLGMLIGMNLSIFILINILQPGNDGNNIEALFALGSSWDSLASHPWTILSYMFSQFDFFHLLVNMAILVAFSRLFIQEASMKALLLLYLSGGLLGGLFFILSFSLIHLQPALLIGSSAAVMSIVTATAFVCSKKKIKLIFFNISAKWFALSCLLLFLLCLAGSNFGGDIAHLGGMTAGLIYGINRKRMLKRDKLSEHIKGETIEALYKKIKLNGYSSLNQEERNRLYHVTAKQNQAL